MDAGKVAADRSWSEHGGSRHGCGRWCCSCDRVYSRRFKTTWVASLTHNRCQIGQSPTQPPTPSPPLFAAAFLPAESAGRGGVSLTS